jgi:hypothetical protein
MLNAASRLAVAYTHYRASSVEIEMRCDSCLNDGDSLSYGNTKEVVSDSEELWEAGSSIRFSVVSHRAKVFDGFVALGLAVDRLALIGGVWGELVALSDSIARELPMIETKIRVPGAGVGEVACLPPWEQIEKLYGQTLAVAALLQRAGYKCTSA